MNKTRLMPRQKAFAENCMLIHTYPTMTDAYISIYRPKGSRRTATASASRIYNRPAVQAYVAELRAVGAQRAMDRAEQEHREFLHTLGIARNE